MHKTRPKICTSCRVKAGPGYDDPPEHPSVQTSSSPCQSVSLLNGFYCTVVWYSKHMGIGYVPHNMWSWGN